MHTGSFSNIRRAPKSTSYTRKCPSVTALANILLCFSAVPDSGRFLCMCELYVSRPNGAAGCPPPSRFHAHSERTAQRTRTCKKNGRLDVRLQRHASRNASGPVAGARWPGTPGCGMGEPTAQCPRPNQPSIPVGGLLVSRLSHECPHPQLGSGKSGSLAGSPGGLASLVGQLPSSQRPVPCHRAQLWHPGPDRVPSLMLRESPWPVTAKATLASWLAE